MAFMFETRLTYQMTEFAFDSELQHVDYADCWQGLKKNFSG